MTTKSVTISRTIACPLFCKGGEGTAVWSFDKGQATITCCDKCKGGSFKVRVTEVEQYLPTPAPVVTYQHRNGLVTLTGCAA
jgi:hypothetical protein